MKKLNYIIPFIVSFLDFVLAIVSLSSGNKAAGILFLIVGIVLFYFGFKLRKNVGK